MPLELQIIRANEFIRLGAQGHFDLPASKAALAELIRACRKRGLDQALLDLRALRPGPKPVFSPADLVSLVNTFPEVGFNRQLRLAILYHSDPHKRARLFAFLSTLHGWRVRAFGDFEAAILWLSGGTETATGLRQSSGARRIPVQHLAPERKPPTISVRPPAPREREATGRKSLVPAMHPSSCLREGPARSRSKIK